MTNALPLPPMPPLAGSCVLPPPKPVKPTVQAPWNELAFEPVLIRPTDAKHCFSVCLYHEPEFAKRFPKRDFAARYLDRMPAVREFLSQHGWHLKIFADDSMLSTALSFEVGDVYRVPGPAKFPFAQHLYRYFAVLLEDHGTVEAYHFRGLDNLLLDAQNLSIAETLVREPLDLEHRPYLRANGTRYTPVRGSCSVAREGIKSLAWWLRTHEHQTPANAWPEPWHSDETYLCRWFEVAKAKLRLLTVIDRELPFEFHADLNRQVRSNQPFTIARLLP